MAAGSGYGTQIAFSIAPAFVRECLARFYFCETQSCYFNQINQLNERSISHVGGRPGYKLPTEL